MGDKGLTPSQILGFLIALASIIGIAIGAEHHFATEFQRIEDKNVLAGMINQVDRKNDKMHLEMQIDQTTNRLWDTQDRLKKDPNNEELQRRERELKERQERQKRQLKQYEGTL
jgi:biopolymer transport protein ExbB/TolQ